MLAVLVDTRATVRDIVMKEIRYVYGTFASREKAEDALENYYADGILSACEMPRIECKKVACYMITLRDINATEALSRS